MFATTLACILVRKCICSDRFVKETAEAKSHPNNKIMEDDFLMNRSLKAHSYTEMLFLRIVLTWLSADHGTQNSPILSFFLPSWNN
jgi:hypothetical protein